MSDKEGEALRDLRTMAEICNRNDKENQREKKDSDRGGDVPHRTRTSTRAMVMYRSLLLFKKCRIKGRPPHKYGQR